MNPRFDWHPHFGRIGGKSLADWLADHPTVGPPVRSIMLATDERTGSEFLCQLMGATGVLGRPSEYLNTYWMRCFIADYPDDVAAQVAIAHQVGTTANRCFSMKVHLLQLERLLTGSRVEAAFPAPVFVRVYRRDLLAQAISLYRARYSGQYHAYVPPTRALDFDGAAIRALMIELAQGKARWELYFTRNGVQPLKLAYEDLVTDPDATIRAIARHAGVGAVPRPVDRPLHIQRDDTSQAWRQQFLAECGDFNALDTL